MGRSLHTCHEKHVQESKLYNADETQAGSWDRTRTDTHFHHIKCAQGENWQSVWAEGLGSFASGKECGSSACPAFIHTSWRTFESIQCTLWYRMLGLKGMQCERTMLWNWKFAWKSFWSLRRTAAAFYSTVELKCETQGRPQNVCILIYRYLLLHCCPPSLLLHHNNGVTNTERFRYDLGVKSGVTFVKL